MSAKHSISQLIGVRSGHLKVVGIEFHNDRTMCRCLCDCGREAWARPSRIESKRSKSCGCEKYEKTKTHGLTKQKSKIHGTWTAMVNRCGNPRHRQYASYGGRGINVCPRWLGRSGFANFLSDMGERPIGHSIDRIDNNKGYSPENCRWATTKTQQRNTRGNRLVTCGERTQCVAAWAEELGVPWHLIAGRISQGWSHERAVKDPYKTKRKKALGQ